MLARKCHSEHQGRRTFYLHIIVPELAGWNPVSSIASLLHDPGQVTFHLSVLHEMAMRIKRPCRVFWAILGAQDMLDTVELPSLKAKSKSSAVPCHPPGEGLHEFLKLTCFHPVTRFNSLGELK